MGLRAEIEQLANLERDVRDVLLDAREQASFERALWYRAIAALDNIGDVAKALENYWSSGFGTEVGEQYLRLFGLLQCIFMQQDSIGFLADHIAKAPLQIGDGSAWGRIRLLRNRIAGHPAERGGAVARMSIGGEQLVVLHWKDDTNFQDIDIREWVGEYAKEAVCHMQALRDATATNHPRPQS